MSTVFWEITDSDLKKALEHEDNAAMRVIGDVYGLSAFSIRYADGSYMERDGSVLYYMESDDESPIVVEGKEIDPEFAFDEYDQFDLSNYVERPDTDKILDIVYNELYLDVDKDDLAKSMFERNYTFTQITDSFEELGLV